MRHVSLRAKFVVNNNIGAKSSMRIKAYINYSLRVNGVEWHWLCQCL